MKLAIMRNKNHTPYLASGDLGTGLPSGALEGLDVVLLGRWDPCTLLLLLLGLSPTGALVGGFPRCHFGRGFHGRCFCDLLGW